MGLASRELPINAFFGAVTLAASTVLPHSAARAVALGDGVGFLGSATSCLPAETSAGPGGPVTRVQADASAFNRRRPAAQAYSAQRSSTRIAAASRTARKSPQSEQEPRAPLFRTLYTCNTAPTGYLTEGTGWRLVGPLRQS